MGIDTYLGRPNIGANHLGIQYGHVLTSAPEILALEAVLYDHIDSGKCITK